MVLSQTASLDSVRNFSSTIPFLDDQNQLTIFEYDLWMYYSTAMRILVNGQTDFLFRLILI